MGGLLYTIVQGSMIHEGISIYVSLGIWLMFIIISLGLIYFQLNSKVERVEQQVHLVVQASSQLRKIQ